MGRSPPTGEHANGLGGRVIDVEGVWLRPHGDVGVGPAEDEATVKRLGHDGPRVMLIPENPALSPFEMVDGRILGKVVAVLRKL